ncbi:NAD(P)/FAD-dependent oxidoreductase [Microbacterium sp. A82]|uniref:NAD(P)/FAD-dependent oxidoreductase n=1 Tax=Microbacterium sp. A82 TaxID=3450452 RepID=UPI003F3CA4EF
MSAVAETGVGELGRVVIVGGGAAGGRFADALRLGGYDGPVTLLGDELHPPYHRPLLSKEVLSSVREIDDILLNSEEDLAAREIVFRAGLRATGIDRPRQVVRTSSGVQVPYDTLVIATGVRPRVLGSAPLGARVHTLHTSVECLDLREALDGARSLTVIGSGFIGSEIAASARELGRDVELISSTRFALQNAMGPWAGARISRLHEERGVRVRPLSRVVDLEADDEGVRVELADGQVIASDLAVIGVGSNPTTGWLEDSGLEIIDGVIVDAHGRTADSRIWAIGDVARRREADGSTHRVEHWTSATEQADGLARHLLGKRPSPIPRVDYLWTDLYGTKIQMLGHLRPGATEHVLLDEKSRFIVAYTVDDRVVGVVAQGIAGRFMRFRVPVASGSRIADLRELAA